MTSLIVSYGGTRLQLDTLAKLACIGDQTSSTWTPDDRRRAAGLSQQQQH